jgi:ankyrin repeat protein
MLLKKTTAGINAVNKNGQTALHASACVQHVECAKVLLRYNCDVNTQVSNFGFFVPETFLLLPLKAVYRRTERISQVKAETTVDLQLHELKHESQ